MNIFLMPLAVTDKDFTRIVQIHNQLSVKKYIKISDQYFDYITNTEGVVYYKIIVDDLVVGGIHTETSNDVMFLSICVDEKYRCRKISTAALTQLFDVLPSTVKKIEVSVDIENVPSNSLFQKLGFTQTSRENELNTYCLLLH